MKHKKIICFKDHFGEWKTSNLEPTKSNLEYIKKHFALNGQATIQKISK